MESLEWTRKGRLGMVRRRRTRRRVEARYEQCEDRVGTGWGLGEDRTGWGQDGDRVGTWRTLENTDTRTGTGR